MKVLYYDVFCGISGDMNLGALVDLGVDLKYLKNELRKLNIDEEFDVVSSRGMKHGISGTKVNVILHNQKKHEHEHEHEHENGHNHNYGHEHENGHDHDHEHGHEHEHNHEHEHEHEHEHDHEHGHEHEHNHSNNHKHNHSHNNVHEHNQAHVHEHGLDHEDEHSHDHGQSHDHEHDHNHTHNDKDERSHDHGQSHDHNHNHEHVSLDNQEHHSHEHRNFALIKGMIESSNLNEHVKKIAVEIFRLVAVAEGKVHGKPIEEVHFHEVGATDSIVDIVGAAICLDALKVDRVMASSIQVGGGFVKCAHGRMPVPAPATAEILSDVPLKYNIVPFETTTPTGAAILKATVNEYSDEHAFTITKIGYGLGNMDFEIPNILRVYLAETEMKTADLIVEEQFVMECNIDDMSGELYTYVEKKLFEAGALDVYKTPIIMKKGRPATMLSVLFTAANRVALQRIILIETTSAGVRETKVTKYMMHRDFIVKATRYGDVKIKNLYLNGAIVKSKPEYDDCVKLAEEHHVSISEIYQELKKE